MSKMDHDNEQFMFDIIDEFSNKLSVKFPEGKAQHGGNLWEKPILKLVDEAKAEHIDGYTYTYTIGHILQTMLADPVIKKRAKEMFK